MSFGVRVFFIFPDGQPSVAHRATLAMLASLPRHNVEAVACFLGGGPLCEVCRDEMGIETVLMAAERGAGAVSGRRARRAVEPVMRGAHPNLVHAVGAAAHVLGAPLAKRVGVPAVWSQFDVAAFGSLVQLRAALTPAAAVLAASSIVEAHQHRVNLRRAPIEVLPPAVRRPTDAADDRRARARQALGLAADALVVGWLAGAEDPDVPLRAVASLCHARGRGRLVVIEDPARPHPPARREAVRAAAAALGIGERVQYAPLPSGVVASPALDALDLAFLAPSAPSPVALAPIEALAAGIALACYDLDPVREYVTQDREGILVPPGDHEVLATALLALADAPELRARMGAAGRATVRERFALDAATRRLAKLHRRIAGEARPQEAARR